MVIFLCLSHLIKTLANDPVFSHNEQLGHVTSCRGLKCIILSTGSIDYCYHDIASPRPETKATTVDLDAKCRRIKSHIFEKVSYLDAITNRIAHG